MQRLGRGTSGLVLFARTDGARRAVAAAWRAGRVEKEYWRSFGSAGRRRVQRRRADRPRPAPALGQVHAAAPGGKPAVSHVRVLAARDGQAVVAVTIPTGRPHQIRIPPRRGRPPAGRRPALCRRRRARPEPALPGEGGYCLHGHRLALAHPATGHRLELECAPPPPLRG